MRKSLYKIAVLPLVIVPTILFACSKAKPLYGDEVTYEDVLRKDICAYYSYISKPDEYPYKEDDIIFTRAFVCVNGAVTFSIEQRQRATIITCDDGYVTYDCQTDNPESGFYFSNRADIPLVWYQHQIARLNDFLDRYNGKDVYSREVFNRIKEMYENKENDFSILDLPFEEPSGQRPFYDMDF